MKATQHAIPHTYKGIEFILGLLNQLKDHNESYFKNTFEYLGRIHPPFEQSLIYYDRVANSFMFVKRERLVNIPIKRWDEYNSGELCLIREDRIAILSVPKYDMIVSNAQFLIDGSAPLDIAGYFNIYIQDLVMAEREIWKKKLLNIYNIETKTTLF